MALGSPRSVGLGGESLKGQGPTATVRPSCGEPRSMPEGLAFATHSRGAAYEDWAGPLRRDCGSGCSNSADRPAHVHGRMVREIMSVAVGRRPTGVPNLTDQPSGGLLAVGNQPSTLRVRLPRPRRIPG